MIGLGETGSALLEFIKGKCKLVLGFDLDHSKFEDDVPLHFEPEVMNICIPYSPSFSEIVLKYIEMFDPHLVIIHSTVKPGTTGFIWEELQKKDPSVRLVHSPIRGNVRDGMLWGLKTYTKFIGGFDKDSVKEAADFLSWLGMKVFIANSPLETEFSKLFETSYYGICIAWFQEMKRISTTFGLKYSDVEDFIRTVETDSGGKVPRPVYFPGLIGGHCVIPNAELLWDVYHSKFLTALFESNEKRKEELKS